LKRGEGEGEGRKMCRGPLLPGDAGRTAEGGDK
jgi:hypothetical protein